MAADWRREGQPTKVLRALARFHAYARDRRIPGRILAKAYTIIQSFPYTDAFLLLEKEQYKDWLTYVMETHKPYEKYEESLTDMEPGTPAVLEVPSESDSDLETKDKRCTLINDRSAQAPRTKSNLPHDKNWLLGMN